MLQTPPHITQRIAKAIEARATKLDLSNEALMFIPDEVWEMDWLEELDASHNYIIAVPEAAKKLTALKTLDLRYNGLSTLPEAITQLTNLTSLNLSDNELSTLLEAITQLTNLTSLDLSSNELSTLPEAITQLTNLTSLDLRDNELSTLPKAITQLTNLTSLDLSYNGLSTLPEAITQLTNLTSLNLRDNELSTLPEAITQLTNLTSLDLSSNVLSTLPEAITQLTNLTSLNLRYNGLSTLPEAITQLTNLTSLNLRYNELSTLPEVITQLTNLTSLDLSSNELSTLPKAITQLTNLTSLNLRDNELSTLPEAITQLTNLTSLDLSSNELSTLPEAITQLTNLTSLDLSYNGLSTLPEAITQLTNLTSLNLRDNRLEIPPPEVVSKGIEAIRTYLLAIGKEEIARLFEAKLIVVGEPGAGKTTLVKKLLDPKFELDPNLASTEGIEVEEWHCTLPDGTPFRTNIWDFGGQEIYHATHQFFLTKRSLYLLLVDTREQKTDFDYWLNVIEVLGDESPVLIVKNEKQDRTWDFDEKRLRGQFEHFKESVRVNLDSNRGLEELVDRIRFYLSDLPHIGSELPQTWVDVRAELEKRSKTADYISQEVYLQICQDNRISNDEGALVLSGYLHDIGTILHFQDHDVLRREVILNPEWGTDAVYRVLDDASIEEKQGRFSREDLASIWHEPQYRQKLPELLALMTRFRLCYEIPTELNTFIAPQLLASESPDYPWKKTRNLQLSYHYPDFMPKGIIVLAIVALHGEIENHDWVWRDGVVLKQGGARAEIISTYSKRRIDIRVSGKNKRDLITIIRREFDKIHQSYHGQLKFEDLIPCNCTHCSESEKPHFYLFTTLQRALKARQPDIQCQISFEDVNVANLLTDILEPDYRIGEDEYWGQRPQKPSPRKPEYDIFISYKWADESSDLANKIEAAFAEHELLIGRDVNEVDYKDDIQAFEDRLSQSTCIILVISDASLKSRHSMYELTAIKENGKFAERVFPVILEDATIFDPIEAIDYVAFWEEQRDTLDNKMKKLKGQQNIQHFQRQLDLFDRIRDTIAEITGVLSKLNAMTREVHEEENFKRLIAAVSNRLGL